MSPSLETYILRVARFLSQLFKSIWLFFPGILFILLAIFCFWLTGQGKDIIVAFTENESRLIKSIHFTYTRIVFFLGIAFWVYVSWYSSRIIAEIKKSKQEDEIQEIAKVDRPTAEKAYEEHKDFIEIGQGFLEEMP